MANKKSRESRTALLRLPCTRLVTAAEAARAPRGARLIELLKKLTEGDTVVVAFVDDHVEFRPLAAVVSVQTGGKPQ